MNVSMFKMLGIVIIRKLNNAININNIVSGIKRLMLYGVWK